MASGPSLASLYGALLTPLDGWWMDTLTGGGGGAWFVFVFLMGPTTPLVFVFSTASRQSRFAQGQSHDGEAVSINRGFLVAQELSSGGLADCY